MTNDTKTLETAKLRLAWRLERPNFLDPRFYAKTISLLGEIATEKVKVV